MLIDWFTVIAQIVNFLVLVVVLKAVLFDRVVRAMDEREARIAERLAEAEEREREAADEIARSEQQQTELAERREQLLAQARAAADERRRELLEAARRDVDEQQARWAEAVRHARGRLVHELRSALGRDVVAVSERALADLADVELEAQVLSAMRRRIERDDESRRVLAAALRDDGTVIVRTAFDADDEQRAGLVAFLREMSGGAELRVAFERDPALVCGAEIRAGGWSLAWSVNDYLQSLGEDVDALLESETAAFVRMPPAGGREREASS